MELTGTWRAAVADDDLRRTWHEDDFDDDGWEAVEVPGHWRSTPAFADATARCSTAGRSTPWARRTVAGRG